MAKRQREVSRDTSDPAQVQSAEEMWELRNYVEQDILGKVLDTYEGRRVLYNILALGDIYDLQGGVSLDAAEAQRQLGRRDVALQVLKLALQVRPQVYIMVQSEAEQFERKFSIENLGSDGDEHE